MVGENSVVSKFDEVQRQNRKVNERTVIYKKFLKHVYYQRTT